MLASKSFDFKSSNNISKWVQDLVSFLNGHYIFLNLKMLVKVGLQSDYTHHTGSHFLLQNLPAFLFWQTHLEYLTFQSSIFSCPVASVMSNSLQPYGAHQASLSLGFSRQECWSGSPCPPPGDLPGPGTEPRVSCISYTAG